MSAMVLFFLAGCLVLTPAVLAGPIAAAAELLLASALFIAALAAMVLGLLTWLCGTPSAVACRVHFCHE